MLVRLAVAICFLCCGLTAQTFGVLPLTSEEHGQWVHDEYRNDILGIYLRRPAGWEIKETSDSNAVISLRNDAPTVLRVLLYNTPSEDRKQTLPQKIAVLRSKTLRTHKATQLEPDTVVLGNTDHPFAGFRYSYQNDKGRRVWESLHQTRLHGYTMTVIMAAFKSEDLTAAEEAFRDSLRFRPEPSSTGNNARRPD